MARELIILPRFKRDYKTACQHPDFDIHALRMVVLGGDADHMYWPDHKRPFIYYW